MERQNIINLKFLKIAKKENPSNLIEIKTLCDYYSQFDNSDIEIVPVDYEELKEMNVKYDELHDALRWLLDIGLLLRPVLGDSNEGHVRAV